jgi:hypothetical protein
MFGNFLTNDLLVSHQNNRNPVFPSGHHCPLDDALGSKITTHGVHCDFHRLPILSVFSDFDNRPPPITAAMRAYPMRGLGFPALLASRKLRGCQAVMGSSFVSSCLRMPSLGVRHKTSPPNF